MATYSPQQLGINASTTGGQFQQGAWYGGRQAWQDANGNWTLGEVNQINPFSNQQGAGQQVSQEVQNQSAKAQGVTPQQFGDYLTKQATQAGTALPVTTTSKGVPGGGVQQQGPISGGGAVTAGGTAPSSDAVNQAQAKIDQINAQITAKQQAAADAIKTENDNPFYSESTRVGRVAKINDALNADLTPLQQQLASATSAYDTAVKAATPDTQVIQTTDDNGNVTLMTVDKKTGNIISEQTQAGIGATKTKAGSATATKEQEYNTNMANAASDAKQGATLQQLVDTYGVSGGLTIDDIYKLYNENSKYGQAKETLAQVKQGQFVTAPQPQQTQKSWWQQITGQ